MAPLLNIRDLRTYFFTRRGVVRALEGLDLTLHDNQVLGLVGESGSGKSVTAYSITRLLSKPGQVVSGQIFFEGTDLLGLTDSEMEQFRGKKIAMIFQNPRSCLNPVLQVGKELVEVLQARRGLTREDAHSAAVGLLKSVELSDVDRVMLSYPHQLSGGMCQRVMIAMALACSPRLLIADEPTTGLDVTIQKQVIQLLKHLAATTGMSQIVITHDLGLVAEICEVVAVMCAGYVVEHAPVVSLFDNPQHPYTIGLLACRPKIGSVGPLRVIPGAAPSPISRPSGCPFHPRCSRAKDVCREEMPPTIAIANNHTVACHFPGPE